MITMCKIAEWSLNQVMVKTFQSSFPHFPNLDKIKVHLDKLYNTDYFFNYLALYGRLHAVEHKINVI